jgi:hypothetical protein
MGRAPFLLAAAALAGFSAATALQVWYLTLGRALGGAGGRGTLTAALLVGAMALGAWLARRPSAGLPAAAWCAFGAACLLVLSPALLDLVQALQPELTSALGLPPASRWVAVPLLLPFLLASLLLGALLAAVPVAAGRRGATATALALLGGALGIGAVRGLAEPTAATALRIAAGAALTTTVLLLAASTRAAAARAPEGADGSPLLAAVPAGGLLAAWPTLFSSVPLQGEVGTSFIPFGVLFGTGAGLLLATWWRPSARYAGVLLVAGGAVAAATLVRARGLPLAILTAGTADPSMAWADEVMPGVLLAMVFVGGALAAGRGRGTGAALAGALAGFLVTRVVLLPALGVAWAILAGSAFAVVGGALVQGRTHPRRAALLALPLLFLALPGVRAALLDAVPSPAEVAAARTAVPPWIRLETVEDAKLYADLMTPSVEETEAAEAPVRIALGLLPGLLHAGAGRALVLGRDAAATIEAVRAASSAEVFAEHEDARIALRWSASREERRYDVIVCTDDCLFTREAWEEARAALAPAGLFAQRLRPGAREAVVTRRALATLSEVFDHVWVLGWETDLLVLCADRRLIAVPERWEEVWGPSHPACAVAAAAGYDTPGALWKHFVADGEALRTLGAEVDGRLDDETLFGSTVASRPGRPWAAARTVLDDLARVAGAPPRVGGGASEDTWEAQAVRSWMAAGRPDHALAWVQRIPSADPGARALRGAVYRANGQAAAAEAELRAIVRTQRDDPELLEAWLHALTAALPPPGPERERALRAAAQATDAHRDHGGVQAALAHLWMEAARPQAAYEAFQRALDADASPAPPGTGFLFARLRLAGGDPDEAAILAVLRADPGALEEAAALDLRLRLEARLGDDETAEALAAALAAMEQRTGRAELRDALRHLRAHRPEDALGAALGAARRLPHEPRAFEALALARLGAGAAAGPPADPGDPARGAVPDLRQGIEGARDAADAERRARAILRWHGIPPTALGGDSSTAATD